MDGHVHAEQQIPETSVQIAANQNQHQPVDGHVHVEQPIPVISAQTAVSQNQAMNWYVQSVERRLTQQQELLSSAQNVVHL